MGLLSGTHASRAPGGRDPHAPASRGRFCTSCHDGATRIAQVGTLAGRTDAAIFPATRTGDPASCARCHVPTDHGRDFTPVHGELAEHGEGTACSACHRRDWAPGDQQRQATLLEAERILQKNPDDPGAALAVGPNNFCVSCHRTDAKWR
jgi:hypothetical protein